LKRTESGAGFNIVKKPAAPVDLFVGGIFRSALVMRTSTFRMSEPPSGLNATSLTFLGALESGRGLVSSLFGGTVQCRRDAAVESELRQFTNTISSSPVTVGNALLLGFDSTCVRKLTRAGILLKIFSIPSRPRTVMTTLPWSTDVVTLPSCEVGTAKNAGSSQLVHAIISPTERASTTGGREVTGESACTTTVIQKP
jgi:hypothetical protein